VPARQHYDTSVCIQAPVETVWRVLTDSAGYRDWNPEILQVDGLMAPGARIKVRVKVKGGAIRTLGLRVTACEPPARLEWTGGMPFGMFVGRRTFVLTRQDACTLFSMHLSMTGPFSPLILKSLGDRQPDIDAFSAALRARVEDAASAGTR
jgi:uncharacterized protein YndB with AHSA1/START domain